MTIKIKYLEWFDVVIISIIMFSLYIDISNINLNLGKVVLDQEITFSPTDNYSEIFLQLSSLAMVFVYLRWRNFDFSQWNIKFSWKAFEYAAIYFILLSIVIDLFFIIFDLLINQYSIKELPTFYPSFNTLNIDVSWLLFALVNGFYYGIFFLGICFSVQKAYLRWVILYSLLLRFLLYIPLGIDVALGCTFVWGGLIILLYHFNKSKNLAPFFLIYTFTSFLGLGILSYIILMILKLT